MAKYHQRGESIEGMEISGCSRDPIRYTRSEKSNKKICHLYKAEFNVSAMVKTSLTDETKLEANAFTSTEDSISCDTAVIKNTDKLKRYREDLKSNVTGTHSANEWRFKKQTNAQIITPRIDVVNAINKRNTSNPPIRI